jgi:CheY-like chemotaxis protein
MTQIKSIPTLKILMMDGDSDIAYLYHYIFLTRGHKVMLARTGEECLKIFSNELYTQMNNPTTSHIQAFDAVILEYKMADRNGLEIAKEILAISPHQRIIFVTSYIEGALSDSIMELGMPVEVLRKPVSNEVLIDTLEDTATYDALKRLKFDPDTFRKASLSHEQLSKILNILQKRKPEFESSSRQLLDTEEGQDRNGFRNS